MDTLRQDLRFALRLLWKDRAFAATAILTLALCIGANTAIFTVVRSVLLRPLPYPDAHRLVVVYDSFPGAGVDRAGTSVPNYLDRLSMVKAFESQALYQFTGYSVGQGTGVEGVGGLGVTPSFFHVLGVSPHRGRTFTRGRSRRGPRARGHPELPLLAARLCVERHRNRPRHPLERRTLHDRRRHARGFRVSRPHVAIWTPVTFSAEQRSEEARHSQNHEQIARLAPGATLAQAEQQNDALTRGIIEARDS